MGFYPKIKIQWTGAIQGIWQFTGIYLADNG